MNKIKLGPWKWNGWGAVWTKEGIKQICILSDEIGDIRERRAIAKLIESSPEVLEALKDVKSELIQCGWNEEDSLLLKVEQAIAKAEGR